MNFGQQPEVRLYQTNWQRMYNQLLYNYYGLAEDYRKAVNRNLQLQKILTGKISNVENQENSLTEKEFKTITQRPLVEYKEQHRQTSRQKETSSNKDEKKEKSRRKKKTNISYEYVCPYAECDRAYDSSVSMNLHIKLKHNGGTKKERQTYAKMILDAKEKGLEPPHVSINFPPGFLKDFKTSYQYIKRYSM